MKCKVLKASSVIDGVFRLIRSSDFYFIPLFSGHYLFTYTIRITYNSYTETCTACMTHVQRALVINVDVQHPEWILCYCYQLLPIPT